MNSVINRCTVIGYAMAVGLVISYGPLARAGWSGNVNGTGTGVCQSNVKSVTGNSATAKTATMKNPSAAIKPASGFSATAALPAGASATTYCQTKTLPGYILKNYTLAVGGDSTDNSFLDSGLIPSNFVASTYLEVTGVDVQPIAGDPDHAFYIFHIRSIGSDSTGVAQKMQFFDTTGLSDPISIVSSDPAQFCFTHLITDGDFSEIVTDCVSATDCVDPSGGSLCGCIDCFSQNGPVSDVGSPSSGWQNTFDQTVFGPADSSKLFVSFDGAAASTPAGPGDTISAANINTIPIASNNVLWLTSVLDTCAIRSNTTICFKNQWINGLPDGPVKVPDATVIFSSTANCASTTFDGQQWITVTPFNNKIFGSTFVSGVSVPLPGGLPGGIKGLVWSGQFRTDRAGVTVTWGWGGAAYKSSFPTDYAALGVKATDDCRKDCRWINYFDPAGTPENARLLVASGLRGIVLNLLGSFTSRKQVNVPVGSCSP